MADELADLRLFVEVVRAGSLSEAARRSKRSLAAISRRLAGFEARLDVRLIDRGSRHFALTDEGAHLLGRATDLIEAADAMLSEVRNYRRGVRGRLRIGAPTEIGRRQIVTICNRFARRYPGVGIDLSLSDARPDLSAGKLDLAVQTKRPTGGDVVQRALLKSRRVICAAPTYVQRRGLPKTPADLAHHDCILMRRHARIYDRWKLRDDAGVREVQVGGTLTCNSTETVHEWVLAGAGIAVKALWDIEDDLREGRLIEVLPSYSCDEINLYVVYAAQRHVPSRVRLFIDLLVDTLRSRNTHREG